MQLIATKLGTDIQDHILRRPATSYPACNKSSKYKHGHNSATYGPIFTKFGIMVDWVGAATFYRSHDAAAQQ